MWQENACVCACVIVWHKGSLTASNSLSSGSCCRVGAWWPIPSAPYFSFNDAQINSSTLFQNSFSALLPPPLCILTFNPPFLHTSGLLQLTVQLLASLPCTFSKVIIPPSPSVAPLITWLIYIRLYSFNAFWNCQCLYLDTSSTVLPGLFALLYLSEEFPFLSLPCIHLSCSVFFSRPCKLSCPLSPSSVCLPRPVFTEQELNLTAWISPSAGI